MNKGLRGVIEKVGLDGRAEDKNGRIREKNGAAKISNLTKVYPELKVYSQKATLTGIKQRHNLNSLNQVRANARKLEALKQILGN